MMELVYKINEEGSQTLVGYFVRCAPGVSRTVKIDNSGLKKLVSKSEEASEKGIQNGNSERV